MQGRSLHGSRRRIVSLEPCTTCRRPLVACVCDRVVTLPTERRVLILQHPQEQDALLGTAQLLSASLPQAQITIGLSWRNLGHALGDEGIDPRRWAVLFPDREAEGEQVMSRRGEALPPESVEGLVVLDGTWSKAKTLWWRNPWLSKLSRMTLKPSKPSIYGKLRAEPRRDYVSTLESVAGGLTLCGESPEVGAQLERLFRTLVQRVRDAKLPVEARTLPRASRPGTPTRKRSEGKARNTEPAAPSAGASGAAPQALHARHDDTKMSRK